ncbi:hypothetical protein C8F04DRAFT_1179203 [Mycena alexandri]|uniref:Uncharacterized protein n=1 Tax=Mycena alexandri TaxID=1745969 RepID=A0AAD6T370_9AGAR|nr:hypothetical protein C8F04DRAFT_1179203 [Mycena alexandri]
MSEAALVLWLVSPVLGNTLRYTILGLSLALLVAYTVDHYTPSRMVFRLENTIKTLQNTLDRTVANCPRDCLELRELGYQLTQVELSVSKIRCQLLDMSGLAMWKKYFQGLRGIFKSITECNKKVKDIDTSVLRIMEGERERQLHTRVEEQRDILAVAWKFVVAVLGLWMPSQDIWRSPSEVMDCGRYFHSVAFVLFALLGVVVRGDKTLFILNYVIATLSPTMYLPGSKGCERPESV